MNELDRLSRREREVVQLLLNGKSNKLIATALGISIRTVEFHLKNIYAKSGVSSRMELVVKLGKSTGGPESATLGSSTVARSDGEAENSGTLNPFSGWALSLNRTAPLTGEELHMKDLFTTVHVPVGVMTALLTGAAWVALMRRFGHIEISPIPWWLPSLVVVLVLLGATIGAIGKNNGASVRRVFISALFGTGMGPFTMVPIVLITVYPLGKLAESLKLVDRATISGDLASGIVTGAMLLIWLAVGLAIGSLLLFLSLRRPHQPNLQRHASGHSA